MNKIDPISSTNTLAKWRLMELTLVLIGVATFHASPAWALTQCGVGCPASYYSTATRTNLSCASRIETVCSPVSGTSLNTCEDHCPSGYYATATGYNSSCGTPYGNLQTSCTLVSGTSLNTCEDRCPSGYYPTGTGYNSSCGSVYFNTQTTCRL